MDSALLSHLICVLLATGNQFSKGLLTYTSKTRMYCLVIDANESN